MVEVDELVKMWTRRWIDIQRFHPLVAWRFEEEAHKKGFTLRDVFKEIAKRLVSSSRAQRVQVPLTRRFYIKNEYGMSLKFYRDGTITYSRGIISGLVYDFFEEEGE